MVGEERAPPVEVPPRPDQRPQDQPRLQAALGQGVQHRLDGHGHLQPQRPRDPVVPALQRPEQPQGAPLVRHRGPARLQHEQDQLVQEEVRPPVLRQAGPPLPVDARDAHQHPPGAVEPGEVPVGVGRGLAPGRHELADGGQGAPAVQALPGGGDAGPAEDAAAQGLR